MAAAVHFASAATVARQVNRVVCATSLSRPTYPIELGEWNTVEAGVDMTYAQYRYGLQAGAAPPGSNGGGAQPLARVLNQDGIGRIASGFVQDRMLLGRKVLIVPGVRTTYFDRTDHRYIEPRLTAYVF